MRERINRLLGEAVSTSAGWRGLTIGTFHSICAYILRPGSGAGAAIDPNYVIFDDSRAAVGDQAGAARSEAGREDVPSGGHAGGHLARQERTDQARGLPGDDLLGRGGAPGLLRATKRSWRPTTRWTSTICFAAPPTCSRSSRRCLRRYQERYQYLLVDEFQDTNTAQYELVSMLAGRSHNLFAVGDEDQCVCRNADHDPPRREPVETLSGRYGHRRRGPRHGSLRRD